MKIIATADLHGHLPEIEECELLLIAGDICPLEHRSVKRQGQWLEHSFAPWIEGRRCQAERVIYIGGNHDFVLERGGPGPRARAAATYLQDSSVEVGGLKIYGTPWTEGPATWAFMLPERARGKAPGSAAPDLETAYGAIPDDADVVLVHGPPLGYGDSTLGGELKGSVPLLERLEEVRPRLTVFGHIHEGRGRFKFGSRPDGSDCWLANVSLMDAAFKPYQPPMTFEL